MPSLESPNPAKWLGLVMSNAASAVEAFVPKIRPKLLREHHSVLRTRLKVSLPISVDVTVLVSVILIVVGLAIHDRGMAFVLRGDGVCRWGSRVCGLLSLRIAVVGETIWRNTVGIVSVHALRCGSGYRTAVVGIQANMGGSNSVRSWYSLFVLAATAFGPHHATRAG